MSRADWILRPIVWFVTASTINVILHEGAHAIAAAAFGLHGKKLAFVGPAHAEAPLEPTNGVYKYKVGSIEVTADTALRDPLSIRAVAYWYPFANADAAGRFATGLRKAGVPE